MRRDLLHKRNGVERYRWLPTNIECLLSQITKIKIDNSTISICALKKHQRNITMRSFSDISIHTPEQIDRNIRNYSEFLSHWYLYTCVTSPVHFVLPKGPSEVMKKDAQSSIVRRKMSRWDMYLRKRWKIHSKIKRTSCLSNDERLYTTKDDTHLF